MQSLWEMLSCCIYIYILIIYIIWDHAHRHTLMYICICMSIYIYIYMNYNACIHILSTWKNHSKRCQIHFFGTLAVWQHDNFGTLSGFLFDIFVPHNWFSDVFGGQVWWHETYPGMQHDWQNDHRRFRKEGGHEWLQGFFSPRCYQWWIENPRFSTFFFDSQKWRSNMSHGNNMIFFFSKWPGPLQQLLVSREFFLFSKSFQSHTSVFYFLGRNIPHPAISEQQWSGALELRIDGKRLLMAEPLGGFIGWDAN